MGTKLKLKTFLITRVLRGRIITRRVPLNGFVSPPEAAALLHVCLRHVYRLLEQGKLPHTKRQGHLGIPCRAVIQRLHQKGGKPNGN